MVFILEFLLLDVGFVREVVKWVMDRKEGSYVGYVYGLEVIFVKESVLKKIRGLKGIEEVNLFLNLLWWVYNSFLKEILCCKGMKK